MTKFKSVFKGSGCYLPKQIMTNNDLAKIVDTSDEWIVERTGIRQRHIASEGEYTSHLALHAAKAALNDAGMKANDIDLIILATSTPDQTFPATAATIQAELGITQGAAFDLQAVCSGFVFALNTADVYLKSGQFKRALVIGAETFSRLLDYEDRTTCVLFGDGAGAFILEAVPQNEKKTDQLRGIIASKIRSDGRYRDKLYVDGGPSTTGTTGKLRMSGREVFRHAVTNISSIITQTLKEADVPVEKIDWFVPHQANERILTATADKIGLNREKIIMTVGDHGNTSAASIPLAFQYGIDSGKISQGDMVLFEAMGGGFTWGAVLLQI